MTLTAHVCFLSQLSPLPGSTTGPTTLLPSSIKPSDSQQELGVLCQCQGAKHQKLDRAVIRPWWGTSPHAAVPVMQNAARSSPAFHQEGLFQLFVKGMT